MAARGRSRRLDEYIRRLSGAARSGSADLDAVIRRLAEEVAEETARRVSGAPTAGLGGLEERLARIEERLRRIEEEVRSLPRGGALDASRLAEELARHLAPAIAAALRQACRVPGSAAAQAAGEEPQWLRQLKERLRDRGYVAARELPPEVKERLDPEELRRRGLVVLELGGDLVVATREALREFQDRLRGLRTGDEYEAETRLGRYGLLFRLLRMEGRLYYAGPSRGWVLSLRA